MKRGPATKLIHHPYRAPEGWDAVPVPVAKASTVLFKDTASLISATVTEQRSLDRPHENLAQPTSRAWERFAIELS